MFSHSDKEVFEDVYLEGLNIIRLYYEKHGIKIKVIRGRYFIERESSTPYKHWQNSVERGFQTMIHNISAVRHGLILIRAYSWKRAFKHWINVHNDLPRSTNQYSPIAIMVNDHQVDAKYQFRFIFRDVVCYLLSEKERRHKFDNKNELGLTSKR